MGSELISLTSWFWCCWCSTLRVTLPVFMFCITALVEPHTLNMRVCPWRLMLGLWASQLRQRPLGTCTQIEIKTYVIVLADE